MENELLIKSIDELENDTRNTYQAIRNLIPKYKIVVERCILFDKAEQQMVKAAEGLVEAMETMGDCGHNDLNVGMLNIANMFSMWKNNLIEITDQFKIICENLVNDSTNLPKELDRAQDEAKKNISKANDEWKKINKKIDTTKKNKKLLSKNPNIINEMQNTEKEKKEVLKTVTVEAYKDALNLLRGSYGTIFENFKKVYDVKVTADSKAEQIFNAQIKDINDLINYTKDIPQKCNTLFSMYNNKFIDDTAFKEESKELLIEIGFNKYAVQKQEIADRLLNSVKTAVENGLFTTSLVKKLMNSIPEDAKKPPVEEELIDILEPIQEDQQQLTQSTPIMTQKKEDTQNNSCLIKSTIPNNSSLVEKA
ncbi:hypothetical protein EHI8A_065480 [Entamoeba histolytica HM-1:IMSS-B]|uniref:Uncharacterized protein n=6 Tax=Entamoeba histolytica TaxID=5759 RepID=C4LXW6_ENTH1|nr:hypothetical protein EHI_087870 [Entamoeba histolytica HM-1:IMSS]EMD48817.1 Hypothetical protein EHI5A_101210 [Entamoeba histolytica KU27]EMH75894.1 hypothetical protein EHI8A_065480 [Entamoeba histolytica HM-1:IMSS-B]EMS12013.1 hypothetical protein KM1_123120 [Entamoeba histolytica HM-3:IMSS]ENY63247.1 hypothetical protein EHI7A_062460 [Entamoeba histolytica HM-1:IMSS-A]GAT93618.1 hypothetical protein CL6EHI_087870 [Entamoeba histolytica]|eukprot:XP_655952.1 hypothetical protein EHI_087870 [Entamoeba histolytica HM-1:IMSS]